MHISFQRRVTAAKQSHTQGVACSTLHPTSSTGAGSPAPAPWLAPKLAILYLTTGRSAHRSCNVHCHIPGAVTRSTRRVGRAGCCMLHAAIGGRGRLGSRACIPPEVAAQAGPALVVRAVDVRRRQRRGHHARRVAHLRPDKFLTKHSRVAWHSCEARTSAVAGSSVKR